MVESRAPLGARGLKSTLVNIDETFEQGRAPLGARGLKSHFPAFFNYFPKSRSARSAWIEIFIPIFLAIRDRLSRSARSAWIEILIHLQCPMMNIVALRSERVD